MLHIHGKWMSLSRRSKTFQMMRHEEHEPKVSAYYIASECLIQQIKSAKYASASYFIMGAQRWLTGVVLILKSGHWFSALT